MDLNQILVLIVAVVILWFIYKALTTDNIITKRPTKTTKRTFGLDVEEPESMRNVKVPNNNQPDWNVNYEAGPKCSCGDVLWQYMSPRMKLQDNGMNCGSAGSGDNGEEYADEPMGVESQLTATYSTE